jgi:hypothetical protein
MADQLAELVLLSSGELVSQGEVRHRISLTRKVTSLGRDPQRADVAVRNMELQGENYISSIHCTIFYEETENNYYLIDNNSTNGTLLNGKALVAGIPTLLDDGDVIELSVMRRGGAVLRFYTNPPQPQDIRRTEPVIQAVPEPERNPITKPVRPTGELDPLALKQPHTVFISYCHDDTQVMHKVRLTLQETYYLRGIEIWTDEHLKVGTSSWSSKIAAAIEKSHGVIVILTPHAKRSEWVERELNYALAQGVRVFPVLAHDSEAASVPFMLIDLQRVDISRDFNLGMQRLVDDIYDHLCRLEEKSS